jgi:hypothetical protein
MAITVRFYMMLYSKIHEGNPTYIYNNYTNKCNSDSAGLVQYSYIVLVFYRSIRIIRPQFRNDGYYRFIVIPSYNHWG